MHMADIGQNKEGLLLKMQEVKIRIRQKESAIFNLDTERMATELNIKRLQSKLGDYDGNIAEITQQIESDKKDLQSLEEAHAVAQ